MKSNRSMHDYLSKCECDSMKDFNDILHQYILDEITDRFRNKIAAVVNDRAYLTDHMGDGRYVNITYGVKFNSLETFELAVDFILSSLALSDNELISFRSVSTEENSIAIRAVKLPADKFRVLNKELKEVWAPQFDSIIGV